MSKQITKGKATKSAAWEDQATAVFGDGAEILAGVDYLRVNPVKIDGIPDHLVHYWANEDDDLSDRHYFKADPQPEHEMCRRGMVLWLTRKDIYEKRKQAERDMANGAVKAAGELSRVKREGGTVYERRGRDSMRDS